VPTQTSISDTIRMPWTPDGNDIVVRPVLGILFNLALGAMASGWVPRFLRYEREGRAAIRWHWPAFLFPAVWAFYRRLWVTGGLMVALPFGLAALYARIDPAFHDSPTSWAAWAVVIIWIMPAIFMALAADSLLYRRVKHEVEEAEASSERKDVVASLLRARRHTAPVTAMALGATMIALLLKVTVPELSVLHEQHVVRAKVSAGLAAVGPVLRQIEEQWERLGSIPRRPDYEAVEGQRGAAFLESLNLSQKTGRVRVALGAAAGAVAGKSLLLAPAIDPQQRIHWYCIAVDVPAQYLPQDCRAG